MKSAFVTETTRVRVQNVPLRVVQQLLPRAQHIQHMQKSLTQMNLKLDRVLSDIMGVTGMLIIAAILNGERHPLKLTALRNERCHHDEATIAKALVGTWRVEHLFTLKQSREHYRMMPRLVAECDARIEEHLQSLADHPAPPRAPAPTCLPHARSRTAKAASRSTPNRCSNTRRASISRGSMASTPTRL